MTTEVEFTAATKCATCGHVGALHVGDWPSCVGCTGPMYCLNYFPTDEDIEDTSEYGGPKYCSRSWPDEGSCLDEKPDRDGKGCPYCLSVYVQRAEAIRRAEEEGK